MLFLTAAFVAVVALGLPAATAAADPTASVAPGRVVLEVDDGRVLHRTGGTGGGIQPTVGIRHVAPLPDGGALLFGDGTAGYEVMYAAKIGRDGALDRSFGSGGVRAFDAPGGANFSTREILPQPDGKLLFVGADGLGLQVTRLNADMSLDRSYGVDGVARTALSCDCAAAQQPDGALVLLGQGPSVTLPATPSAQ